MGVVNLGRELRVPLCNTSDKSMNILKVFHMS